jgi:hypothetical protein
MMMIAGPEASRCGKAMRGKDARGPDAGTWLQGIAGTSCLRHRFLGSDAGSHGGDLQVCNALLTHLHDRSGC